MTRWKRWILSVAGSVILLLILGLASMSGCGAASVLLINPDWQRPVVVEIINNETTVWQGRLDGPQIRTVFLTGLMGGGLDVKATLSDGTVLSAEEYLVPDHVHAINFGASTMIAIGKKEIVQSPWRYWMAFGIEPDTFLGDVMSMIDMFPHGAIVPRATAARHTGMVVRRPGRVRHCMPGPCRPASGTSITPPGQLPRPIWAVGRP